MWADILHISESAGAGSSLYGPPAGCGCKDNNNLHNTIGTATWASLDISWIGYNSMGEANSTNSDHSLQAYRYEISWTRSQWYRELKWRLPRLLGTIDTINYLSSGLGMLVHAQEMLMCLVMQALLFVCSNMCMGWCTYVGEFESGVYMCASTVQAYSCLSMQSMRNSKAFNTNTWDCVGVSTWCTHALLSSHKEVTAQQNDMCTHIHKRAHAHTWGPWLTSVKLLHAQGAILTSVLLLRASACH